MGQAGNQMQAQHVFRPRRDRIVERWSGPDGE